MIKILSPSRSLEITKVQIEAGADEIYLGVDMDDFNIYSFGGRFKKMNGIQTQLHSYDELRENVEYCKQHNVDLQLTANMHYVPRELEKHYLEFIKTAVDIGVDQLIISNMGLIRLVREAGINTYIVAGSFTFIPNSEHVRMLKDLGVNRVVLPHATKISEINTIKDKVPDMDIEIFALIGGGNNCGRCMMFHAPIRRDIGPGCRAKYKLDYDGKTYEDVKFLDAAADCALCSMKELADAGVNSLKIVGRENANDVVMPKFTEIFYQYREGMLAGKERNEIKKCLDDNGITWKMVWEPKFCANGKCKFNPTKVTNSYI